MMSHTNTEYTLRLGADPEHVVEGGAIILGGRRPNIFIHFLKNPMKLKKFWSGGGGQALKEALKARHIRNVIMSWES